MKSRIFTLTMALIIGCCAILHGQQYFPTDDWERKTPASFGIDAAAMQQIIDSTTLFEYKGPKDLSQAILKGFEREPYHQILPLVAPRKTDVKPK